MTPKNKAEELINKFYNYVFNPESHKDDNLKWAKECALIAVDEILNLGYDDRLYLDSNDKKFWEEVKQEINKL